MNYSDWIKEHYPTYESAYGRCAEAVKKMSKEFPELKIVRGHVMCLWGKRAHWWLTDAEGNIIDPTVTQFPGTINYDEWKPGDQIRVGKCMNCGDEIWKSVSTIEVRYITESVCSKTCEANLMKSLNS